MPQPPPAQLQPPNFIVLNPNDLLSNRREPPYVPLPPADLAAGDGGMRRLRVVGNEDEWAARGLVMPDQEDEMNQKNDALRVVLTPDGFYPLSFGGGGGSCVCCMSKVCTAVGRERRYRVRTQDGPFELGLHLDTGSGECTAALAGWRGRGRIWPTRRAIRCQPGDGVHAVIRPRPTKLAPVAGGGGYAGGHALVR